MYWCGLRYGEAVNLRFDARNIDFDKGEIDIFNQAGTKTLPPFHVKDYEARTVPMNTWVVDMLQELRAKADKDCPYVFLTSERLKRVQARWQKLQKARKSGDWENRFMLNGVLRNFKARCVRAGIRTDLTLTLHGLRKSWATNLANSGKVPPKTLLELGGWSDMKVCEEFYLRSSDANRQRACDVLNELAGSGE
jgi:integrase